VKKPLVFLTPEAVEAMEWVPFPEGPEGMWEKVLSRDEETGSYTRLIKADPQLVISEKRVHDFCNPPGYEHGPYTSATGWLALEFVYYD
jgi:hypothetical protein